MNCTPMSVQEVQDRLLVNDKESVAAINAILDKLPADCEWFRVAANESLLERCRHIYHESWRVLSSGSGKPMVTAQCIADGGQTIPAEFSHQVAHIKKLEAAFAPAKCGPMLLGANDIDNGLFILIDGNHRASALCLRQCLQESRELIELEFFVACSSQPIWVWS